MNQSAKIEIIDRNGWRREFPLEKTIVHIGSDPRSDIVLESVHGVGVAPLHAQLIAANGGLGYQLVNLGDVDILLGSSGDQTLPPRSVTKVVNGTLFKLGEFTLIFHGGEESSAGFIGSRYVGLNMSLPQTQLGPKRSLDGAITVSNLGDRSGVQINLELEGLESECYDIEPGPILSSGAEKEVFFHLYHRRDKPLAGDHRITIRATAPLAYPNEEATVSQVVHVLPTYRHTLRLLPPEGVVPSPQVEEQRRIPAKAGPPPAAKRVTGAEAGPSPQAEDWWAPSPIAVTEQRPQAEEVAPLPIKAVEQPPQPRIDTQPPAEQGWAQVVQRVQEDWSALAAEVNTLPAMKGTPQVKAGPSAQIKERGTTEAETVPPAKKGWAGLVQLLPFHHRKQTPAPAAVAGAEPRVEAEVAATPPLEDRSTLTAEAGTTPAMEGVPPVEAGPPARIEEERMAETKTVAPLLPEGEEVPEIEAGPQPQAEERLVEAEAGLPAPREAGVTEAETVVSLPLESKGAPEVGPQPPAAERPAVQPEVAAPVAEERMPKAEARPEEQPKKQRVLKLKASPPPETAPVEAGPVPAGDGWTPEAETGVEEPPGKRRVLKLKASLPPETEPAPVEAGPPPVEVWWTTEAEAGPERPPKKQVLKLKASPPPEAEPAPVEAGPPPAAEDWWTP
jgi:hypothetical protein